MIKYTHIYNHMRMWKKQNHHNYRYSKHLILQNYWIFDDQVSIRAFLVHLWISTRCQTNALQNGRQCFDHVRNLVSESSYEKGRRKCHTLRIQVCPKKGISPKILLQIWDWDHQWYFREGPGFVGIYNPWANYYNSAIFLSQNCGGIFWVIPCLLNHLSWGDQAAVWSLFFLFPTYLVFLGGPTRVLSLGAWVVLLFDTWEFLHPAHPKSRYPQVWDRCKPQTSNHQLINYPFSLLKVSGQNNFRPLTRLSGFKIASKNWTWIDRGAGEAKSTCIENLGFYWRSKTYIPSWQLTNDFIVKTRNEQNTKFLVISKRSSTDVLRCGCLCPFGRCLILEKHPKIPKACISEYVYYRYVWYVTINIYVPFKYVYSYIIYIYFGNNPESPEPSLKNQILILDQEQQVLLFDGNHGSSPFSNC